MRLLVTYNGIIKILTNATQYEQLIKFIHQNFLTLKKDSFTLSYIDSDGDSVTLGSQMDFQTMNQTVSSHHLKIFIKEEESDNKIFNDKIIQHQEIFSKAIENKQDEKKEEKSQIRNYNTPEELPINKIEELQPQIKQVPTQSQINKEDNFEQKNWNRCGGYWNKRKWFGQMSQVQCQERKKQWKQRVNEQIAKQVDSRIQVLLPLIVKKVEQSLAQKGEIKSENVQKIIKTQGKKAVSVHKNVKCSLCFSQPIVGIRYKCVKCPVFNLCSECQPKIDHNHNMIKMKYQQEPEIKSYEKPFKLQNMSDCNMRDPKFALTKKCFKLASIYGGQPEDYVQYVNDHLYEPISTLIEKYRLQNKVSFSQKMGTKLQNLAKKLAFYFNKKAQEFIHLVQENPNLHFKGLLRKAQQQQEEAKLVEQISKIQKEKPSIKIQIPVINVSEKNQEIKQEQKPKESEFGIFSIKPRIEDPVKKADVILRLKDLFGQQKSYQYIKFYNEHIQEQTDTIIDKYIQSQFI